MAKRGYRLHEIISVQNLLRFFNTIINIDARCLLNEIYELDPSLNTMCICISFLFFVREGE